VGTIGLGDRVHQVDRTIGCPFLAAGDRHPVRPGVTTGDRQFWAGSDHLGENRGRKGIEKKAIGHYSKKIPIETGRSGQGDRGRARRW